MKTGRNAAMTLIELVVVLSIIGLLAAIAVPSFMRARMRALCSTMLHECRQIDAAKDQWALENSKPGTAIPEWTDLTPYLKAGSYLVMNGGKDSLGNPIRIGSVRERLTISPKTVAATTAAADDQFWGPYYPENALAAVQRNDLNLLKKVIAQGKDVNASQGEAIIEAVSFGQTEFVAFLLDHGARAGVDQNLWSKAAYDGNEEITKLLEKAGVSPVADLFYAAALGNVAEIEVLIAKGADANKKYANGGTPLMRAAANGHLDAAKVLMSRGVDVNARDNARKTPLIYAAECDRASLVESFIAGGADVNAVEQYSRTALREAAYEGHSSAVEALLKGGANINAKDVNGFTPLMEAVGNGQTESVQVLIAKGAYVNAQAYYGRTALGDATLKGYTNVVELLKRAGAALDLPAAAAIGDIRTVRELLAQGANVNATNRAGRTPLMLTVLPRMHADVAALLVEKGADPNQKDCNGQTALEWAKGSRQTRMVELLKKAGAKE